MNTRIIKKRGAAKLVALVLTAIFAASGLAAGLGNTLAAPDEIVVDLTCESGVSAAYTMEAGQMKTQSSMNLFEAHSTNTDIAEVRYTKGSGLDNIRTTGVSAGVASVAFATKGGMLSYVTYQVTDSGNVSAYRIKDGGEVYFTKAGVTKNTPVNVTQGYISRISWRSMNENVATVTKNGTIISQGIGATVIIGSFTDKWGVDRDLHLLAGVGVVLSESDLGRLLELIKEGEFVLKHDNDHYTTDSLDALEEAVAGGKNIIDSRDPSEQEILGAINDLENALNNLAKRPVRPDNILGPDIENNWYKPVGDPPNVYEVVDDEGKSKVPPEYVYNEDGDPVDSYEKNRPAYHRGGYYYVEDPKGSNLYKKVKGDGTLQDSPAIWGGPDGEFGTADDERATMFDDGTYWVHVAQNVWQQVEEPTVLGELTGGGPDENPAKNMARPVFLHKYKYYIGPLGPEDDQYYYGDKVSGGDGKLNSTEDVLHETDQKYYLLDGNMTTEKPITDGKGAGVGDKELGTDLTGDTSKWLAIAKNGEYYLIIREEFINIYPGNAGNAAYQGSIFGAKNAYSGSMLQTQINKWFTGEANPPEVLPADARLRQFTVKNTAIAEVGGGPATNGYNTGFSKPITERDDIGYNIAFALSYGEAAQFLSYDYSGASGGMTESPQYAKDNFVKMAMIAGLPSYDSMWLRSPGSSAQSASVLTYTGRVFQRQINGGGGEAALVYPALWVHQDIFETN